VSWETALYDYLSQLYSDNDIDLEDQINYKQWVHTDRTTLVSLQAPLSEFLNTVCEAFDGLRSHHFVAKSQSLYLRQLKDSLSPESVIVLLDFAENYSFLIQDAVQGHHWDNSQATLHPFAVYYRENETLKCLSFCIISDCMKHDTTTVHAFISVLLFHLKQILPVVKKVIYFSDGAASQYKNYKNFANLCEHYADFNMEAEWHFFATSHGKSPCDGIGGTVKRLAARASLQATFDNHIITPQGMFLWAEKHIEGIKFFYVTGDDVQNHEKRFDLESRYLKAKTLPGTRSHHSFVPVSGTELHMWQLSSDSIYSTVYCDDKTAHKSTRKDYCEYQPGRYIACIYDGQWYIGNIVERSDTNSDILVKFMKRSGLNLSWPPESRKDECWVPFPHVLTIISAPEVHGRAARQYRLLAADYERVENEFALFLSNQ